MLILSTPHWEKCLPSGDDSSLTSVSPMSQVHVLDSTSCVLAFTLHTSHKINTKSWLTVKSVSYFIWEPCVSACEPWWHIQSWAQLASCPSCTVCVSAAARRPLLLILEVPVWKLLKPISGQDSSQTGGLPEGHWRWLWVDCLQLWVWLQ
jgi:hypothetical protein